MITLANCILLALLFHVSSTVAQFAWNDCGVQLSRNIHYESASISPNSATGGNPLSINVKASVVSTVSYADTRVIVLKDGQSFLDVYIQDLCSIIQTSESLSCPLVPGKSFSFTYTFASIPQLPSGRYDITVMSLLGSTELGCIKLSGDVNGLSSSSCQYTSSFNASVVGLIRHQTDSPLDRQVGDWLRAGPIDSNSYDYGTFSAPLFSTPDLAGTFPLDSYVWALNGSLVNIVKTNATSALQTYLGNFVVGIKTNGTATNIFTGSFNWVLNVNTDRAPAQVYSGTLSLNPKYVYNSIYNFPVVLGNLAPFELTMRSDNGFVVSATRTWCTCKIDSCGNCGGDGSTCTGKAIVPSSNPGLTPRETAAIVIGIVGGLVGIIVIIILSRMIVKTKRARPHDDSDLIDHPQKPDYGTMAIDESIREGERGL